MSEGDEKENVEDFIRFKGFFFPCLLVLIFGVLSMFPA